MPESLRRVEAQANSGHAAESSGAVDQKGRGVAEEQTEQRIRLRRQRDLVQRALHQRDPAFAGGPIDTERGVARTKARMATLLDIAGWTAKPEHEKIAQPLFAPHEIVAGIHRPEDVVTGHVGVERSHQSGESGLANHGVDIAFGHLRIIPS